MKFINKKMALAIFSVSVLILSVICLSGCIGNGENETNTTNSTNVTNSTNPINNKKPGGTLPTALPVHKNTDPKYVGFATADMVNPKISNMEFAAVMETESEKDNPEMGINLKGFEGIYLGNGNLYLYAYTAKSSYEADKAIENIIKTFENKTEKYIKETKINGHDALVSAEKKIGVDERVEYTYYWAKGNLVFIAVGNGVDQNKVEEGAKAINI
ncbi:MAG: hypothetical protein GX362_04690 [Methanosarcinaceae archaeon]|nr:hypothetical protein [Methanosarcinaceae archaeon]